MAEEKLPYLSEAHIRNLASGPSFERGKSYYRDGAVLEPVCQEMELRAQCKGSDYEPYGVSATLTKDSIAETSCTCPYDCGGICKHIIALLLTYVHKPQAFRLIPPLAALLAGRSQEELIEREPELLSLVELSIPAEQARQGEPLDVAAFRRQARQALLHESPHAVEKGFTVPSSTPLTAKRSTCTSSRSAARGRWIRRRGGTSCPHVFMISCLKANRRGT